MTLEQAFNFRMLSGKALKDMSDEDWRLEMKRRRDEVKAMLKTESVTELEFQRLPPPTARTTGTPLLEPSMTTKSPIGDLAELAPT
jgi:hypothetical protein